MGHEFEDEDEESFQNEGYENGDVERFVTPKWYEDISPDPAEFPTVTDQVLIELKDEAKKCLESETATYNIKNAKTNPDYRWMKTVMSKGTVSDKIAAYTVIIQDNPVYNLETIRNLISMVKVGKKKECTIVIDSLSELFVSNLLRVDTKLKPFHARSLSKLDEMSSGNAVTRRKYLCYWYFEDQLKEAYTTFVQALNAVAHDTVDSNKEKAISAMSKLLEGNPEQEKNLLANLVNKLGDPSQKVASKAMYCLTQLLYKHSNMQVVVLKEIEKLMFRQNVKDRAQYYSLCFLSQFCLNHENPEVPRKLIEVYFAFFKKCIKEGDVDRRMMSVLLIGVNRAYPYAKLEMEKISEHINTIYRIVHIANFNVSLHALCLLYQVSDCSNNINDRYYSALYRKLLDPKFTTTKHQAILLNLVFKSIMRDEQVNRISAFIKRMLQICIYVEPSYACGILFLISHILKKKQNVNLLELKKKVVIDEEFGDDDDEEKYQDIKDESDEKIKDTPEKSEEDKEQEKVEDIEFANLSDPTRPKIASWFHCQKTSQKPIKNLNNYDPLARNPLHAGAEHSAYVELLHLKNHFHPTVALFAGKLLDDERIVYSGDPLKDFTVIRFLERFVFKNPKKVEEIRHQDPTFTKRKLYQPTGIRSLPVTSNDYLLLKQDKIPIEELFMFNYLQTKYANRKEKSEDMEESDTESVASEEFEEMLDSMPGFKDLDDDVDYMNDVGESLKSKKSKGKKVSEDTDNDASDSSDDEIEDEDSFMEDDFGEEGDDELFKNLDDDEGDDEGLDFGSDYDDESESFSKRKFKDKKTNKDTGSIFASAEEFASILEDEGSAPIAPGGSNQYSDVDKAGVKQLDWEDKRNRWIQGYNKAVGKKGSFKGKAGFKNKNFKGKQNHFGDKKDFNGKKPNHSKKKRQNTSKSFDGKNKKSKHV